MQKSFLRRALGRLWYWWGRLLAFIPGTSMFGTLWSKMGRWLRRIPAIALLFLVGCVAAAGGGQKPALPPIRFPSITPQNLEGISASMAWLAVLAVLGIAGGVAAVIIMPGDDKIPFGVIVGSGVMLAMALLVQTSLPFLPWIVGGTLVFGLIWLLIRIHRRKENNDAAKG